MIKLPKNVIDATIIRYDATSPDTLIHTADVEVWCRFESSKAGIKPLERHYNDDGEEVSREYSVPKAKAFSVLASIFQQYHRQKAKDRKRRDSKLRPAPTPAA